MPGNRRTARAHQHKEAGVFVPEGPDDGSARLSSPKSGHGMPRMCHPQARLRRGGYDRPARGAKVSGGGQSLAPQVKRRGGDGSYLPFTRHFLPGLRRA